MFHVYIYHTGYTPAFRQDFLANILLVQKILGAILKSAHEPSGPLLSELIPVSVALSD